MRSDGMICGMSDENSFAAVASSAMTMPWILTCSRATKNVDSLCKGLLCPGMSLGGCRIASHCAESSRPLNRCLLHDTNPIKLTSPDSIEYADGGRITLCSPDIVASSTRIFRVHSFAWLTLWRCMDSCGHRTQTLHSQSDEDTRVVCVSALTHKNQLRLPRRARWQI